MLLQFHTGHGLATLEVAPHGPRAWRVMLDGEPIEVELVDAAPGRLELRLDGRRVQAWVAEAAGVTHVGVEGRCHAFPHHTGDEGPDEASEPGGPHVAAPLPGKVVRVLAAPGQTVAAGEPVLILEAMKMETEIAAPRSGVVQAVHVAAGGVVALGAPLFDLEPA